ncbi:MAG: hypothetical protein ACI4GW_00940 [Lachnospiraceae bacterium]
MSLKVSDILEGDTKSDFVIILREMMNDANSLESIKVQLMDVIQQAKHYSYYRKCWDSFSLQELSQRNKERTEMHDLFIIELNRLADNVVKATGRETSWRDLLGNDRKILGDFAEYIADYTDSIKERISILEAVAWAQEHHNQIMYMSDTAKDYEDFKCQLMEQYGFDENQAQAIIDMSNRNFTMQERERVREELNMLLCMIEIDE